LYVALASGKVYRLVDNLSSLVVDGAWTTNPYDCGCTIVSPLAMDATNLYWGGMQSGNKLWTLAQATGTAPVVPFDITPTVTTAAPATWVSGGVTNMFVGTVGNILKVDMTNQTLLATNTNPGSASVWGRVGVATNGGVTRVFAGDDGGNLWAIDQSNFTGTNRLWTYAVSGDQIRSSPYYDYATSRIHFGTEGGKVVVLDGSGLALTGYPYTPGTASDAIRSALLYRSGVMAVGTRTGKVFFIDRNNGTTGPALIRQYYFGPTQEVSGVGYDSRVNRYMVTTSDPTVKDGRLYYIDAITDPTAGSS
jgi:hypothetical protein